MAGAFGRTPGGSFISRQAWRRRCSGDVKITPRDTLGHFLSHFDARATRALRTRYAVRCGGFPILLATATLTWPRRTSAQRVGVLPVYTIHDRACESGAAAGRNCCFKRVCCRMELLGTELNVLTLRPILSACRNNTLPRRPRALPSFSNSAKRRRLSATPNAPPNEQPSTWSNVGTSSARCC